MSNFKANKDTFCFGASVTAVADKSMISDTLQDLWRGFCSSAGLLEFSEGEALRFSIGDCVPAELKENDFVISVRTGGLTIVAKDREALIGGYMALVEMIEAESTQKGAECFKIPCCELAFCPKLSKRMIHLCVFPENSLTFIKKVIRLCGVLRYTHIILEFWGMLKYDCLSELAWDNAFSKAEVSGLLREASDMGMEVIPMLNHLGHASQSRVRMGKHVVLDQNPLLAPLFTKDGWCWNIESDKTKCLLKQMRAELCGLFGECSYFHIGCDEAYTFMADRTRGAAMGDYLGELIQEVVAEGRKPIMWGDMLLKKGDFPEGERYYGADLPEATRDYILERIGREVIIADWQYSIKNAPVVTTEFFVRKGFETIVCPWHERENINAYLKTAQANNCGFMLTTWDTLSSEMHSLVFAAKLLWGADYGETISHLNYAAIFAETATLLRKVHFSKSYEDAGWAQRQIIM